MAKHDDDDNFDEVLEWLFSLNYNPVFPSGVLKAGVQVGVVVAVQILLKALDGETCGLGWKWYFPQTWGNPIGCFARGLVRGIPTPSFEFNPPEDGEEKEKSGSGKSGGTFIAPPSPTP